jgi:hypothetical protein
VFECDAESDNEIQTADFCKEVLLAQDWVDLVSLFDVYPDQSAQDMRWDAEAALELPALKVAVP